MLTKKRTVDVLSSIALLALLLLFASYSRGTLADRANAGNYTLIFAAVLAALSFVLVLLLDSKLGPSSSARFSPAKFWYVNLIGACMMVLIVTPVLLRGDREQLVAGVLSLSYTWSASLFEEAVFRALLFRGLLFVKYSWRISAIVSSVIFCAAHLFSSEVGHLVNGLIFSTMYFVTGSLMLVTVSHTLLNLIVDNFNCNKVDAALCSLPFSADINSTLSAVVPFGFVGLLALLAIIAHDRFQKQTLVGRN